MRAALLMLLLGVLPLCALAAAAGPAFATVATASSPAAAATTLPASAPKTEADSTDDDWAPGLGLFAVLMIAALVAIGAAMAVLAVLFVLGLGAVSVVTTLFGITAFAALAAFVHRRASTFLWAMIVQLAMVLGGGCGLGLGAIARIIFQCRMLYVIAAAAGGAISGLVVGLILVWLAKHLVRFTSAHDQLSRVFSARYAKKV